MKTGDLVLMVYFATWKATRPWFYPLLGKPKCDSAIGDIDVRIDVLRQSVAVPNNNNLYNSGPAWSTGRDARKSKQFHPSQLSSSPNSELPEGSMWIVRNFIKLSMVFNLEFSRLSRQGPRAKGQGPRPPRRPGSAGNVIPQLPILPHAA
jgi:hypothetical protein